MRSSFFLLGFGCVLMLLSCSNSYVDKIDRSEGYQYRPGFPELRVVASGYIDENDDAFINIASEIVYASLVYKRKENVNKADFNITYQILNLDNPDEIISAKEFPIQITDPKNSLSNDQNTYRLTKNFEVAPGNFRIITTILDNNSDKEISRISEVFIPNIEGEESNITNIRIFKKTKGTDSEYYPTTTYDIQSDIDSLKFVFQVTNKSADSDLTINSRLVRFRSDTSIARPMNYNNYTPSTIEYKGIDYSKETEINTNRRVLTNKGNVTVEFTFPELERGNFLMTEKEYEELMSIDNDEDLKKAVDRFWLSNIKNSRIAKSAIELYYSRVEEANKQFSNYKEGWKTDQGMIYILFGPPWYVDKSSVSEMIWSYSYNFSDPEKNFLFISPTVNNKYFPFDNYILQRNTFYYNISYQQSQLWRSGRVF
jgi:GWxTD domain-containing protein